MKFSFYCEIYKVCIYVYFGDIDDKLHQFLRHLKSVGYNREHHESICKTSAGVASRHGRNVCLWMPCAPKTAKEYSTLVHEITHITWYIFEMCGMECTEEIDEGFAYLSGWIARKIFDKILKKETVAA